VSSIEKFDSSSVDTDIVSDDRYRGPGDEYKEFRTEAEKAIRHCQEVFGIDTDFVVKLAKTDTTGFNPQEAHPGHSFTGVFSRGRHARQQAKPGVCQGDDPGRLLEAGTEGYAEPRDRAPILVSDGI
jgi:hypothetical protein